MPPAKPVELSRLARAEFACEKSKVDLCLEEVAVVVAAVVVEVKVKVEELPDASGWRARTIMRALLERSAGREN